MTLHFLQDIAPTTRLGINFSATLLACLAIALSYSDTPKEAIKTVTGFVSIGPRDTAYQGGLFKVDIILGKVLHVEASCKNKLMSRISDEAFRSSSVKHPLQLKDWHPIEVASLSGV